MNSVSVPKEFSHSCLVLVFVKGAYVLCSFQRHKLHSVKL